MRWQRYSRITQKVTWDTLSNILQGGFKGFANMDCSELIEEYESMEDIWYNQKVADKELQFDAI